MKHNRNTRTGPAAANHTVLLTGATTRRSIEPAQQFRRRGSRGGARWIVYLGGLGDGQELSRHLASRQEVGQILRCTGVPTVEFRASIVIGAGSASYEIVRALVEQLPVTVAPRWVDTLLSRSRSRTLSHIS